MDTVQPHTFQNFLSMLAKQEKTVRWGLGTENIPGKSDEIDSLVLAASEDFDNFMAVAKQEEYSEFYLYGILVLSVFRKIREVLSPVPRQVNVKLTVWLADVSFLAGYEYGTFHGHARTTFDRINNPTNNDLVEKVSILESLLKGFYHPEGRKNKEGARKENLRETFNSYLEREKKNPTWRQLFTEWKKTSKKPGSRFTNIRKDEKYIYFTEVTKSGKANKEGKLSLGRFKNIRTEIIKEIVTPSTKRD